MTHEKPVEADSSMKHFIKTSQCVYILFHFIRKLSIKCFHSKELIANELKLIRVEWKIPRYICVFFSLENKIKKQSWKEAICDSEDWRILTCNDYINTYKSTYNDFNSGLTTPQIEVILHYPNHELTNWLTG